MNDMDTDPRAKDLVLEYELDASPEKVWRAISIPAFREQWLPKEPLADMELVSSAPGEEIRYRMRDGEAPFLESLVTFQVRSNAVGGTTLKIIHGLADARLERQPPRAANNNWPCLMRAA
ncbi:polyketide cyclase [Phyllobacterium salinisoli]|uniref:Polyketide cyclase n=1 Tax=Phyllobacterium salinisoli TaxID=1899321 RepID=A0A368K448_9HYPH|nr:SRPBCC family protein [Phyllobacterium salinisoli]RCS24158.1 polyketide cyclase [Phyllobacterium salinisoli]